MRFNRRQRQGDGPGAHDRQLFTGASQNTLVSFRRIFFIKVAVNYDIYMIGGTNMNHSED